MLPTRADSSTQTEEDLIVEGGGEENENVSNASKDDTKSDLGQEIENEDAAYEEDDFEEDNEEEKEKSGNESEDKGERVAKDMSDGSSSDSNSSSSSDSENEEEGSKAVKEKKKGKKEKVEEKSGSEKEEDITETVEVQQISFILVHFISFCFNSLNTSFFHSTRLIQFHLI